MEKDNSRGFRERFACYVASSLRLEKMAKNDEDDKGAIISQIDLLLQIVGDLEERGWDGNEFKKFKKRASGLARKAGFTDLMIEESLFLGREHRRLGISLGIENHESELELLSASRDHIKNG